MSVVIDSAERPDSRGDESLRRCALTLHAIAGDDRAWVLSRLSGPGRAELERLIAELNTLGIAPDPRFAHVPVDDRVDLMAGVLQAEPPRLVAYFLLSARDEVAMRILQRMDDSRRQSVQQHLDALQSGSRPGAPRRLAAALRERLDQRVQAAQVAAGSRLEPGPSASWLRWSRWRSAWRRLVGVRT